MTTNYNFKKQIFFILLFINNCFMYGQEITLVGENYNFWKGKLSENYNNSSNTYLYKDNSIYKAEQNGWSLTTGNFYGSNISNFALKEFFVDNNNVIWLYNMTTNVISKSIDNGTTWSFINIPIGVSPIFNDTKLFVRNNKLYFSALCFYNNSSNAKRVLFTLDYLVNNSSWNSLPLNNSYGYSLGVNYPLYQIFEDGSMWDGVYISYDNGITWSEEWFNIPPDQNPSYPDVDYFVSKDKSMVFHTSYLSNYSSFISSNSGQTYTQCSGLPYNTPIEWINFYNNGLIICSATFNGNGVFQSTDGLYISYNYGASFVKINNNFNFWDNVLIDGFTKDSNYLYTSYNKNGINRININNTSSNNFNNGVNNIVPHDIKKIDCDNNGNLYALINGYGIFTSNNDGISWIKDLDSSSPYSAPTNICASNNNIVYTSGYDPGIINKSINNGLNWSIIGGQHSPYTIKKLFADKVNSNRVFFTSQPASGTGTPAYIGTFASYNGGASFGNSSGSYATSIDSELAKDILFANESTIYALYNNRIMKSINNGGTWIQTSNTNFNKIVFDNENNKLYAHNGTQIFESSNESINWVQIPNLINSSTILDIIIVGQNQSDKAIIASTNTGIYKYDLINSTWGLITQNTFSFIVYNKLSNKIFLSNVNGMKYINLNNSANYNVISIVGQNIGTPWETDIDLTTTNGINYQLLNQSLPTGEIKFRQDHTWTINWGGSTTTGTFPTSNGIQNGANIPAIAGTYDITFNKTTGVYSFNSTLSTSDNQFLKNNIVCYPNPTNDIVNVSANSDVINQINVYDMFGRLLKSQKGSSDNEKINIQELPNAIYLVEIKTDKINKTVKIIKE